MYNPPIILTKIVNGILYAFIIFHLILSIIKKEPINETLPNYNWWVLFIALEIWYHLKFKKVKIDFDEDEKEN